MSIKKADKSIKFYQNDEWNNWTAKSSRVPFETSKRAVGDGEEKLAAEYNVVPLGQNSGYDLEILGEKWEVKKLDSDSSFRLGVEISTSYNFIIGAVIKIVEVVLYLKDHLLDSEIDQQIKLCIDKIEDNSGRSTISLLDGLRKNEVSHSNLIKANDIIEILKKFIIKDKKTISLHSSITGKKNEYDLLDAFRILTIEKVPVEEKLKILGGIEIYSHLNVLSMISDEIQIFDEANLQEKLNQIVRGVFHNYKLILVHKDKGYKPISNLESIICNRITSGSPRCKIVEIAKITKKKN
ncbi:hypothetical protein [Chryseobacterium sp. MP_3.2]|uniref:hypothetical protein n=1 Tax=Chryseobacterium sp. MP_3.2 TaxID=3071712 RepID=UPI002DFA79BD|nr:hypothetical protein [Chryseobacterium sp. MP_3.2]